MNAGGIIVGVVCALAVCVLVLAAAVWRLRADNQWLLGELTTETGRRRCRRRDCVLEDPGTGGTRRAGRAAQRRSPPRYIQGGR